MADAAVGSAIDDGGFSVFVAGMEFVAEADGLSLDFGECACDVIGGAECDHGHAFGRCACGFSGLLTWFSAIGVAGKDGACAVCFILSAVDGVGVVAGFVAVLECGTVACAGIGERAAASVRIGIEVADVHVGVELEFGDACAADGIAVVIGVICAVHFNFGVCVILAFFAADASVSEAVSRADRGIGVSGGDRCAGDEFAGWCAFEVAEFVGGAGFGALTEFRDTLCIWRTGGFNDFTVLACGGFCVGDTEAAGGIRQWVGLCFGTLCDVFDFVQDGAGEFAGCGACTAALGFALKRRA